MSFDFNINLSSLSSEFSLIRRQTETLRNAVSGSAASAQSTAFGVGGGPLGGNSPGDILRAFDEDYKLVKEDEQQKRMDMMERLSRMIEQMQGKSEARTTRMSELSNEHATSLQKQNELRYSIREQQGLDRSFVNDVKDQLTVNKAKENESFYEWMTLLLQGFPDIFRSP